MAIAFDAATMNGANITTATTTAFDHTPVGTPAAVIVVLDENCSADNDNITSVSYGGVAMSRRRWEHKGTSEFVQCYIYELYASIPTGKQSVSVVTKAGGTFQIRAMCITVTTTTGLAEYDADAGFNQLGTTQATSIVTTAATPTFIAGGLSYGGNAGLTAVVASSTHINAAVFTNSSGSFFRASHTGGSVSVGYSGSNNDDKAMAVIAIKEKKSSTTPVSETRSVIYNIIAPVSETRTVKYNIIAPVSETRAVKYNILQALSETRGVKYDIRAAVSETRKAIYNIIAAVSETRSIKYNILNPVSETRDVIYDLLQLIEVSESRAVIYDVLAQVAEQRAVTYDIGAGVSDTRNVIYNIVAAVAEERDLIYDILQLVADTRLIDYDVIAAVAETRGIKYDVRASTSEQRAIVYDVLKAVSETRGVEYDMLNALSRDRDIIYDGLAAVSETRTISYRIGDEQPAGPNAPLRPKTGFGR